METSAPPALAFYFCLTHPRHVRHASPQILARAARTSLPFCKSVNIAGDAFQGHGEAAREVHVIGSLMSNRLPLLLLQLFFLWDAILLGNLTYFFLRHIIQYNTCTVDLVGDNSSKEKHNYGFCFVLLFFLFKVSQKLPPLRNLRNRLCWLTLNKSHSSILPILPMESVFNLNFPWIPFQMSLLYKCRGSDQ